MRLTDEQVEALTAAKDDRRGGGIHVGDELRAGEDYGDVMAAEVHALAREVQEYRALRSVMAAALRAVNAGSFTPFDALAQIVAELASLDSRAVADGH